MKKVTPFSFHCKYIFIPVTHHNEKQIALLFACILLSEGGLLSIKKQHITFICYSKQYYFFQRYWNERLWFPGEGRCDIWT